MPDPTLKSAASALGLALLLTSCTGGGGSGGTSPTTSSSSATTLSISPNPLVGSAGSSLHISVDYQAQGAQVSGLEFDLLYDPNVLSITTATAGSGAIDASKTLGNNPISPGDLRFIISGINQKVFGAGSVADLTVQVSNSAPAGPYSLSLSNIVASDPNGLPVPIK